jgi:hypothetical protein
MPSARDKFEALAEAWEPSSASPSPLLVTRMYLWVNSTGAKKEGVSPRLSAMVKALRAQLDKEHPTWYESMWDGHDYCRVCGERYRMENLSMCTHCDALHGPCHMGSGGLASNGNSLCAACHVGEIVG